MTVRRTGSKWTAYASSGRSLGSSPSHTLAEQRSREAAAVRDQRGPGFAKGLVPKPGLASWAASDAPRELPVPDVRQRRSYTCGPACLLAACAFFGVPATEEELSELCGTDEDGTPPDALAAGARQKGLTADVHEDLSLEDLAAFLAEGALPVVALQAWSADGPQHDYAAEWGDGHYAVPTAVSPDLIVFEDPSVEDKRVTLSPEEFLARWHDVADGERQDRLAVVLRGSRGLSDAPAPVPVGAMEPMG